MEARSGSDWTCGTFDRAATGQQDAAIEQQQPANLGLACFCP
jgi:hypothetical protein